MDKNNADKVSEATEKMTEAVRGSYEVVIEGAAAAHESNVQLAQSFFGDSIEALRAQAKNNRETAEALAEQAQRQQRALQDMSQESVFAYASFLDSMCSYYDGLLEDPEESSK